MVLLSRMTVESVALTKQEGVPYLLDGNKLYFTYQVRGKKNVEEIRHGYVDLSVSRKTFTPCTESTIPVIPKRRTVDIDWKLVAYGFWMINEGAIKGELNHYPRSEGDQTVGYLSFVDFRHALWCCYERNEQWVKDRFNSWNITEELLTLAKSTAARMKTDLEEALNRGFRPVRQLSPELTAQVLGIFDFHGDKKDLVTALKTSWDAEIKDSEVKVDKFLTSKIQLPETIEELIP